MSAGNEEIEGPRKFMLILGGFVRLKIEMMLRIERLILMYVNLELCSDSNCYCHVDAKIIDKGSFRSPSDLSMINQSN